MTVVEREAVDSRRISLVRLIAEGHSGRVYAAMDNVLGRRVLVKRLSIASFEDPAEHQRLIDEARVLSRIDHPNLLRIHDYRERDGHDLLTLEYADGVPLPDVIEELGFTTRVRIATAIASALLAAHRHGVVHGALSPESVIVAKNGEVKVTDFLPITTRVDGLRGGAQWQSPEQSAGEPATWAADMYAFGLVLRSMFGDRDRDVRQLMAMLLREAPADRATAAAALEHLQRLGRRRIRRIRTATIAAIALGFVAASAKYAIDLNRERAQAVRARAEADARRIEANQLAAFIIDDLHPKLESVGRLDVMDAAAAEAVKYFGSLPAETSSPQEAAMNGRAVSHVGIVQASKGDFSHAIGTLNQAVAMIDAAARRAPDDAEIQFMAADTRSELAAALDKAGRNDESVVHSRLYASSIDDLVRKHPGNLRFRKARAAAANHIGSQYERREDSARALQEFQIAAGIIRQFLITDSSDKTVFEAGLGFYKAGVAQLKAGHLAAAETQLEEGRRLLASRIDRPDAPMLMRQLLAVYHDHLAAVAVARGDLATAARHAASERALMEQLTAFEPGNADWAKQLAIALRTSGSVSRMSGDVSGALQWHSRALSILQDTAVRDGETALLKTEIAIARTELARSFLAAGRAGAAAANAGEAANLLGPMRENIAVHRALAGTLLVLGTTHAARGDRAGAEAVWRNALDVVGPLDAISLDPRIADVHASLLVRLGRAAEARPLIDSLVTLGYRNPEFEVLCVRRDDPPGNRSTKGVP